MGFEIDSSLLRDPFFELRTVIATDRIYPAGIIQRAVRAYMPRTYEDLLKYDLLSFMYASCNAFTAEQHNWFSKAVLEEGRGLLLIAQGNPVTLSWLADWMDAPIGDVLPIYTKDMPVTCPSRVRILEDRHPLATSLPWSSIGGYGIFNEYNPSTAKTGSEVVAELVPQGIVGRSAVPFIVWWDVGETRGRSVTLLPVYSAPEPTYDPFRNWEYYPDFMSNLHLYAARREIPPDPEILHSVRQANGDYRTMSGLLISFVEFISKLGGNPTQVERIMTQADARLRDAERLYLDYDFQGSLKLVRDSIADLERAEGMTIELKDKTLFSIYVIEWAVLTSTSLVAGFLAWSLMVKRRLYAEAKTTRLARMVDLVFPVIGARRDD